MTDMDMDIDMNMNTDNFNWQLFKIKSVESTKFFLKTENWILSTVAILKFKNKYSIKLTFSHNKHCAVDQRIIRQQDVQQTTEVVPNSGYQTNFFQARDYQNISHQTGE